MEPVAHRATAPPSLDRASTEAVLAHASPQGRAADSEQLRRCRTTVTGRAKSFLDVLRSKHRKPAPKPGPNPNSHNDQMDCLRDSIRKEFAAMLRGLQLEELMVLDENFASFWSPLYAELRGSVCSATESDDYREDEGVDWAFRRRMERVKKKLRRVRGRRMSSSWSQPETAMVNLSCVIGYQ